MKAECMQKIMITAVAAVLTLVLTACNGAGRIRGGALVARRLRTRDGGHPRS